jgi:hypothetical protein
MLRCCCRWLTCSQQDQAVKNTERSNQFFEFIAATMNSISTYNQANKVQEKAAKGMIEVIKCHGANITSAISGGAPASCSPKPSRFSFLDALNAEMGPKTMGTYGSFSTSQ